MCRANVSCRFPIMNRPAVKSPKAARTNNPTITFFFAMALFLRNESACGFMFTLLHLGGSTEGDQVAFVKHSETVTYASRPMLIVCNDKDGGSAFCLLIDK